MSRYEKWCPKGCGKCVIQKGVKKNKVGKIIYLWHCKRCLKVFTKEQLIKW